MTKQQQQHPITPPLKLMQQWADKQDFPTLEDIATQAARWGADQELEACCEWASQFNYDDYRYQDELLAARRPKPPSLAEQALMALEDGDIGPAASLTPVEVCIIRRALERLQELEQQENNDN